MLGHITAYWTSQLVFVAATLGLADEAYQTVTQLARRYWRPSGVSTHNAGAIFNTDVCGGLPAVVVAMLIRARDDRIDVLPALPPQWPAGEIRGVRLRGGAVVDRLAWSPGEVRVDIVADRELTVAGPPGVKMLLGGR
jgi:hypothetical protein